MPHDPETGERLIRQTPQQIVDRILAMDEGTRFQVLAPVVRGRKGTYDTLLDDLAAQGEVVPLRRGASVVAWSRCRPTPVQFRHRRTSPCRVIGYRCAWRAQVAVSHSR